ncbi:hypothetical protein OOK60_08930 [Trichothermofontia sichuanensis B231]|uniref:hypothetical protein n=1 Tax=Trichothermofontia sichuanensis TaxID=3045816 RepID=UPI002245BA9E|nr:hypothetical protein [Trichothermofontia sichuanensis]UZQ56156.1 hypothetical protein OOK60_08930 [Trichothermofontia sichuanensis B231]
MTIMLSADVALYQARCREIGGLGQRSRSAIGYSSNLYDLISMTDQGLSLLIVP